MEKPKTIAIIGGTGKIGGMFAKAFKEKGYEVIIASRETEISMEDAAARGDVVIVSIPIRNTKEVIEKISGNLKKDALLTDFTSVKVMPCKVMEKSFKGEVIGGHPVFGPFTGFKGLVLMLFVVLQLNKI